MFSLLPTKLNSGVLPGLLRKWYIFDMLLVFGRYSSFSFFACRVSFFCSSLGELFLLLKLLRKDVSRLCCRGEPGGDCG